LDLATVIILQSKVVSLTSNHKPVGPGLYIYVPQWQVSQLYPQASGSIFIAFCDSQGYGGGILTHIRDTKLGYYFYIPRSELKDTIGTSIFTTSASHLSLHWFDPSPCLCLSPNHVTCHMLSTPVRACPSERPDNFSKRRLFRLPKQTLRSSLHLPRAAPPYLYPSI
jgi:hypothetical protein